jgi:hypothetical protein
VRHRGDGFQGIELQGKLDGVTSQITPLPERKERALFSRVILQNNFQAHFDFFLSHARVRLKKLSFTRTPVAPNARG